MVPGAVGARQEKVGLRAARWAMEACRKTDTHLILADLYSRLICLVSLMEQQIEQRRPPSLFDEPEQKSD